MIGKMDQSVVLYTAEYTPDGYGGNSVTLTSAGVFYAEVETLSSKTGVEEREHAMREQFRMMASFRMHNFEGLPKASTSVIEWLGVKYDVAGIDYDGPQNLFVVFKGVAGELNGA